MNHRYRLVNVNILTAVWAALVCVYALSSVMYTASGTANHSHVMGISEIGIAVLTLLGVIRFRRIHMATIQKYMRFSVSGFWFFVLWAFILVALVVTSPLIQLYFLVSGALMILSVVMRFIMRADMPALRLWNTGRVRDIISERATYVWPRANVDTVRNMDISERVARWRVLTSVKPLGADAVKAAGDDGERAVLEALQKHRSLKGAYLYSNKRIPNIHVGHALLPGKRAEIDLILLTHRHVHVIEIKNWSGQLDSDTRNPLKWVRIKRRHSEPDVCNNVVATNALKLHSLKDYLGKQGVLVSESQMCNYVFFTNQNLILSDTLKRLPEIVTVDSIRSFSSNAGMKTLDKIVIQLAKIVLDKEHADHIGQGLCGVIPDQMHTALDKALDALPTWDKLTLHGGRELAGDLRWMDAWGSRSESNVMQRGHYYRIDWHRNKYVSLLRTLIGWPLGRVNHNAIPDPMGTVCFHVAGQERPSVFPLVQVDLIEKG